MPSLLDPIRLGAIQANRILMVPLRPDDVTTWYTQGSAGYIDPTADLSRQCPEISCCPFR